MDKKTRREKLNVSCVQYARGSVEFIKIDFVSVRFSNIFNLVRNIISFALCAFIMQVHVYNKSMGLFHFVCYAE